MKSFQDLVCPGHYKVTMGHHLLLRSPKGSLKHWAFLIISIVPGGLRRSSGKVERANQFLKSAIKKITQETSLDGRRLLLCTRIAPKEQVGLSPYEMLYERPFVYVNDLFLDPEAQTFWSYTMIIEQFQQDMHLWGVNQTPKILKSHHYMLQGLKS